MKRVRRFVITMWQPLLLYSLGAAVILALLCFKLGSLPTHLSPDDVAAVQATHSWHSLLDNPLYAPHKIILVGLQAAGLRSLVALRSASIAWALLMLLFFFSTLRHWFTKRIAVIGTLLLASSSWFLVDARSVTPEIMQAGLIALLAVGGWLRYSRARVLPLLLGVGLTAVLCYIPGMVWFVLLAIFWQRRTIKTALEETRLGTTLIASVLTVALLAPLIYALVRSPRQAQTLLGLPASLPTWQQLAHNAINVPLALFVRAPANPTHWLGHMPLLDVFAAVMFALGLYSFYYRRQLDRAKVLTGIGLFGGLLITLGGGISLTLLLPAVYIIITAGVNLMLQQWLTVFPRNPLARTLGTLLLVLAVAASSFYQLDRYYRAWQRAPATKQIYSRSL